MPFPIVPVAMAALTLGKGIAEGIGAKKKEKEAARLHAAIPREDPRVLGLLNDIQLRQKYAENGQSRMLAYKNRTALNAGAQTGVNMVRSAGTSPGSVQQGLLRSEANTQSSLMRAGAETEALAPQFMAMRAPLVSDMADRKLALDQYPRDQAAFTGAQRRQNSNDLIWGSLGLMSHLAPSLTGGGGGGGSVGAPKSSPIMTPPALATPQYQVPADPSLMGISGGINPNSPVPGLDQAGQAPWWLGGI